MLVTSSIQTAFGAFSIFQGIPTAFQTGQAADILRQLDGPAAFVLDRGCVQTRVVSCLLHGNEPSGLRAVAQAFQRGPQSPHANVIYFIGNVRAAKANPDYFSHRLIDIPNIPQPYCDMNRIWCPDAPLGVKALTSGFHNLLKGRSIEAFLDLHNTSGHNPSFGIIPPDSSSCANLAGQFVDRVILLPLQTGFMGALGVYGPGVVVECGKMGLSQSDVVAMRNLQRFLSTDLSADKLPDLFYHVDAAVMLNPSTGIDFKGDSRSEKLLSLRPDIERLNFAAPGKGVLLGTYLGEGFPVRMDDSSDAALFFDRRDEGGIWLKAGYVVAMATLSEENIRRSCLFYLLRKMNFNI